MRACLLLGLVVASGALACSESSTFGDAGAGAGGGGPSATTGSGASGGASSSQGGAAGETGAGGAGQGCAWSADANPCGEGFYCNAPDCMNGTCEPLAKNDDGIKAPVCGCDGVNYWNANTAAAYGMPAASNGECAQPFSCAAPDVKPCPSERHFCGQLVPNFTACVVDPTIDSGVCWGMPEECPPIVTGGTYRPCSNNEPCVDECAAIKGKRKYFNDPSCPQ